MRTVTKYLSGLLLVALAAYVAWPYVALYRLDRSLAADDRPALARLVDLDVVRAEMKRSVERDLADALGDEPGSFTAWLRDGVETLGAEGIDALVDVEWVSRRLAQAGRPRNARLLQRIDYAFFERWDRFLVRVGELGDDPLHVRMRLAGGRWRVTGLYR